MRQVRNPLSIIAITFLSCLTFAAAPNYTTFQTKIISPSGLPLEGPAVNFRFTILDSFGTCVLYIEDYVAVNMSGSSGVVSFSLGSGVKSYPGTATLMSEVFNNSVTVPHACQAGGTYAPGPTDRRHVVMQFNDGSGWQTLPQMAINAVFYANYATTSEKLGNYVSTDYLRPATLPSCIAGQALHYNGTSFTCVTSSAASGVTSVNVNSPLSIVNTTSTPVISLAQASAAASGYLSSADWSAFNAKANATLPAGNLYVGNGSNAAAGVTLSGDATLNSSGDLSLVNSGVAPGTYGSASNVPVLAVDSKGRVTSATSTPYQNATGAVKGVVQVGSNISVSAGVISVTSADVTNALTYVPMSNATQVFLQNGNSFGAAANLGTSDNNNLNFMTSGTPKMTVQPDGNVGIGTTTPLSLLHVDTINTSNGGGSEQSAFINTSVAPTAAIGDRAGLVVVTSVPGTNTVNLSELRGIFSYATISGSGNANAINGARLYGEYNGSGTATEINGSLMGAGAGGGNVTTLNATHAFALNYGSNINTMTGMYIVTNNLSGTVTNRYSILLKSPGGAATNDFGVYQEGAGQKNYFAGKVGIGTTTPTTLLDLNSNENSIDGVRVTNSITTGGAGFIGQNDLGNIGRLFKVGSGWGPYKNIGNNDLGFYNGSGGNISILNDEPTGNINFAAGGSATAQMTISSAGSVGIGVPSPSTALDVSGGMTFRGVAAAAATPTAAQGKIYYNTTLNKFQVSENGAAHVNLVPGVTNPIASGATVDLSTSPSHTLASVGGSTIALTNMHDGGVYNIVVEDNTARTYTFSGCSASYFKPANAPTTAATRTVYGVMTVKKGGGSWDCYITWSSGFAP